MAGIGGQLAQEYTRWLENPYRQHFWRSIFSVQTAVLTRVILCISDVDRGYRGNEWIDRTEVVMPKRLKRESYYKRRMRKARCQSRAGVEGLISHLKHDHRMLRNYLKGVNGDKINTLLAASAYNMKKWMNRMREKILFCFSGRSFCSPVYSLAYISA